MALEMQPTPSDAEASSASDREHGVAHVHFFEEHLHVTSSPEAHAESKLLCSTTLPITPESSRVAGDIGASLVIITFLGIYCRLIINTYKRLDMDPEVYTARGCFPLQSGRDGPLLPAAMMVVFVLAMVGYLGHAHRLGALPTARHYVPYWAYRNRFFILPYSIVVLSELVSVLLEGASVEYVILRPVSTLIFAVSVPLLFAMIDVIFSLAPGAGTAALHLLRFMLVCAMTMLVLAYTVTKLNLMACSEDGTTGNALVARNIVNSISSAMSTIWLSKGVRILFLKIRAPHRLSIAFTNSRAFRSDISSSATAKDKPMETPLL